MRAVKEGGKLPPELVIKDHELVEVEDEAALKADFETCRYCGLLMGDHDDSGFCPPGTEEFGGRR